MLEKLSGKLLPLLLSVALGSVALLCILLVYRDRSSDLEQTRQLSELVALSQKLPSQADALLNGSAAAVTALEASQKRYTALVGELSPSIQGLSATALLDQAKLIVGAKDAVEQVNKAAALTHRSLPQLLQSMGNLVSVLGPSAVAKLDRFQLNSLQVDQSMQALAAGNGDLLQTSRRLADDLESLGTVVNSFGRDENVQIRGSEAEQKFRQLKAAYAGVSEPVRAAISMASRVQAAYDANTTLAVEADKLYTLFQERVGESQAGILDSATIPLGLAGIALVALLLMLAGHASSGQVRKAAVLQARKNERNQEAILRLLDELSNLADGDLTVQATVTEDITGAIADSINYAIEALRELVATINDTAITLDSGAKQTLASAGHLAKASVAQSKQVTAASESVATMAASIEEVSGNAERSSDVARHSVEIAHKGSAAVRRMIDGMNAIREAIQETSKRIKRLGESSQEIGNIVELINDIAEQTNILALNASIQASMAGEAGRGFAVVADEVQRLAERAANATKQIEVLVRTIQADTNEAVVSMERSTTDVVGGTLLAENAGGALEEIEQVSNQIASLVQNISATARQQAAGSQNIAKNMHALREISSQTASNSAVTTSSISKLAELSTQLRKSVAGFRLPERRVSPAPVQAEPVKKPTKAPPAVASNVNVQQVQAPAPKKVSGLGA